MVRDILVYGVLGAVLYLLVCGMVVAGEDLAFPPALVHNAQRVYAFVASPLGAPPAEPEAEVVARGVVNAFLVSGLVGLFVSLLRP